MINYPKLCFVVKYRLVSKWGLERGEVGGFSASKIFNSFDEATEFASSYPLADDYRQTRMKGYLELEKYAVYNTFFYGVPKIEKHTILLTKKSDMQKIKIPDHARYEVLSVDEKDQYSRGSYDTLDTNLTIFKRLKKFPGDVVLIGVDQF